MKLAVYMGCLIGIMSIPAGKYEYSEGIMITCRSTTRARLSRLQFVAYMPNTPHKCPQACSLMVPHPNEL